MSTDPYDVLALGASPPGREPDVAAIWHRGRRRRLGRLVAACAVPLALVAGTVGAILSSATSDNTTRLRVLTSPDQWTTYRDQAHGLSISYPPSWQVAPSTLTPVLGDPIVPIALGTYPLDPERPGECDIVPKRALEALGPTDAFIAVYLYQGAATETSTLQRPAHFTPDLLPSTTHIQCTENVHGSVSDLGFWDHGRKISFLIAIGTNATPERRHELYRILDTLVVDPQPTR